MKNPHGVEPTRFMKRKESEYAIKCDPEYGPFFVPNAGPFQDIFEIASSLSFLFINRVGSTPWGFFNVKINALESSFASIDY